MVILCLGPVQPGLSLEMWWKLRRSQFLHRPISPTCIRWERASTGVRTAPVCAPGSSHVAGCPLQGMWRRPDSWQSRLDIRTATTGCGHPSDTTVQAPSGTSHLAFGCQASQTEVLNSSAHFGREVARMEDCMILNACGGPRDFSVCVNLTEIHFSGCEGSAREARLTLTLS